MVKVFGVRAYMTTYVVRQCIWFFISTTMKHYVRALMYTRSRSVSPVPTAVSLNTIYSNTRAVGWVFVVVFIFSFHHFERRSEIVCETNIVILINTICETAFSLPYIFIHHTNTYHTFGHTLYAHSRVCICCRSLFCYTKRWIIYS